MMPTGNGGDGQGDGQNNDDACTAGTAGFAADLAGPSDRAARMTYRETAGGCREFVTTVSGFPAGEYEVVVAGVALGVVTAGEAGAGELSFDTIRDNFPPGFPTIAAGVAASVGGDVVGMFEDDCPATPLICVGQGGTPINETCTEDAAAWIQIDFENVQTLERNSPCTFLKEKLITRTAGVTISNRHPTRSIAVAAIVITTSDRRNLPRSPCDYLIGEGIYPSQADCLANLNQGCNSPSSLIIGPQQTSVQWVFNCFQEDLFPGNGPCGEQMIETFQASVLVQGVFCNNFQVGQSVFCDPVSPHLQMTGEPYADYQAVRDSSCP